VHPIILLVCNFQCKWSVFLTLSLAFVGADQGSALGSLELDRDIGVMALFRPSNEQKVLLDESRSIQRGYVAEVEKENQALREKNQVLADGMIAGLDESTSQPRSTLPCGRMLACVVSNQHTQLGATKPRRKPTQSLEAQLAALQRQFQEQVEAQKQKFEEQEQKFKAQNTVIASLKNKIAGHQENLDELNRVCTQSNSEYTY
jgi:hypothetical protein